MHGQTLRNWAATAALLVPIAVGIVLLHADDQQSAASTAKARQVRSGAVDTRHPRPEYNIRYRRPADAQVFAWPAELERSAVNPSGDRVSPLLSGSSAYAPPPSSPGLMFAKTSDDLQHFHSSGYQTGRISGANIVHFTWTHWNKIPTHIENADRFVNYTSYTVGTGFNQPFDGCQVSLGVFARGGYTDLGVGAANDAHEFFDQRADIGLPYSSWRGWFPLPGQCLHIEDELATIPVFGQVLWPHGTVQRNAGGTDIVHVLAHGAAPYGYETGNWDPAERIVYWRYNGTNWEGPVAIDSSFTLGYVVAADPNSDKVAIVLHTDREPQFGGVNNIAYYESSHDGEGWINGFQFDDFTKHFVTDYTNPDGPQAWLHISTAYDNAGVLHIVWDEQRIADRTADVAIRHWSDARNTIRPVAFGYWPSPQSSGLYDLNLSKLTLGIGDGSTPCEGGTTTNENYLYVLYTRFGGPSPEEQADFSALGWYNGELHLNVSSTGGSSWSPPVNLTNTKTPHCNPGPGTPINPDPPRPDSVCRSEHWATIGQIVDDIDIFFISDIDAGAIILGEGTWQMNPVYYYRIPGGTTDAQHLCPLIQPTFAATITADIDCEYHAPGGGTAVATLTVINLGNAALSGEITAAEFNGPPGWLTVGGGGAYSIPPGGDDRVLTVNMNAAGVADGTLLAGQISITHNDPSTPSPQVFLIDFFVFDDFACPEHEVLRTGVASPGSLALRVQNDGRYAAFDAEGGLFRLADSSSAIWDASFLLAYGPQSPDTVVFHRFGDSNDPGQFGFRPQTILQIDTTAYGTGQGYAHAWADMSTKDSVVGVRVDWYFPQHPDSDEFVIGMWGIYSRIGNPIANIVCGLLQNADVMPAAKWGQVQSGADNTPGHDVTRRLVWQTGIDTTGHISDGVRTATRYRGGIRVLSNEPLIGARVGNVDDFGAPGPSSGFLYGSLVMMSGIELFTDSASDLYMMVTLDKGIDLGGNDTFYVVAALISDTVSEASLKGTSDKANIWGRSRGLLSTPACQCAPCHANPACDGTNDVLDVIATVAVAFRGYPEIQDPECPVPRTDVDCNGYTDVIDVVIMVSPAFRGGNPVTEFCNPCI